MPNHITANDQLVIMKNCCLPTPHTRCQDCDYAVARCTRSDHFPTGGVAVTMVTGLSGVKRVNCPTGIERDS